MTLCGSETIKTLNTYPKVILLDKLNTTRIEKRWIDSLFEFSTKYTSCGPSYEIYDSLTKEVYSGKEFKMNRESGIDVDKS